MNVSYCTVTLTAALIYSLSRVQVNVSGERNTYHGMVREIEYPTMHYFGIPRDTYSMIADKF